MGFWSGRSPSPTYSTHSKNRSSSRHESSSRRDGEGPYTRPSAARSASSFLEGITGYNADSVRLERDQKEREREHERSRSQSARQHSVSNPGFFGASTSRGLFGFGSSSNNNRYGTSTYSSSGTRARPRAGFINKVKKWLRDLYMYMRRNPMKVFMLVIMPLITGGALTKLLSVVGIRLPPSIERMMGSNMNRGMGGMAGQRMYARGGARDFEGGTMLPGMTGGVGQSLGGLMSLARMFVESRPELPDEEAWFPDFGLGDWVDE